MVSEEPSATDTRQPHDPARSAPEYRSGLVLRPIDVFPLEFGKGCLELVPMTRETYHRFTFTDRGRIIPAGARVGRPGSVPSSTNSSGAEPPPIDLAAMVTPERPGDVLAVAIEQAGAVLDPARSEEIIDGELFRRHAKDPGRPFDAGKREAEMEALTGALTPELDRAVRSVERVSGDDTVELPLAAPLV